MIFSHQQLDSEREKRKLIETNIDGATASSP